MPILRRTFQTANPCLGASADAIFPAVLPSLPTPCFTPVATMCRKRPPCFWRTPFLPFPNHPAVCSTFVPPREARARCGGPYCPTGHSWWQTSLFGSVRRCSTRTSQSGGIPTRLSQMPTLKPLPLWAGSSMPLELMSLVGEGMFRKDETAVAEWSEANVINCAERQWNIICDVWPALRRGGYLVYSTCTYNREENEDNVLRICHELGAEPVPLQVPKSWNIVGDTTGRNLPVYHFFPHRTRGEGLFLALLRKTADAPEMKMAKAKGRSKGANNRRVSEAPCGAATVASWLADADDFRILPTEDGRLIAVRSHVSDAVLKVRAVVPTLSAGILLAESKGAKFIPQHPLALSDQLSHTAFPRVEIDLPTALAYLRREAITLPPEVPRSYVVLTHGGHPLGFANNIGTRANNMYPQEWRIRKEL